MACEHLAILHTLRRDLAGFKVSHGFDNLLFQAFLAGHILKVLQQA